MTCIHGAKGICKTCFRKKGIRYFKNIKHRKPVKTFDGRSKFIFCGKHLSIWLKKYDECLYAIWTIAAGRKISKCVVQKI